jgi:hypothetical protein
MEEEKELVEGFYLMEASLSRLIDDSSEGRAASPPPAHGGFHKSRHHRKRGRGRHHQQQQQQQQQKLKGWKLEEHREEEEEEEEEERIAAIPPGQISAPQKNRLNPAATPYMPGPRGMPTRTILPLRPPYLVAPCMVGPPPALPIRSSSFGQPFFVYHHVPPPCFNYQFGENEALRHDVTEEEMEQQPCVAEAPDFADAAGDAKDSTPLSSPSSSTRSGTSATTSSNTAEVLLPAGDGPEIHGSVSAAAEECVMDAVLLGDGPEIHGSVSAAAEECVMDAVLLVVEEPEEQMDEAAAQQQFSHEAVELNPADVPLSPHDATSTSSGTMNHSDALGVLLVDAEHQDGVENGAIGAIASASLEQSDEDSQLDKDDCCARQDVEGACIVHRKVTEVKRMTILEFYALGITFLLVYLIAKCLHAGVLAMTGVSIA